MHESFESTIIHLQWLEQGVLYFPLEKVQKIIFETEIPKKISKIMICILGATKEDAKVVTDLLSSVGLCERVPESQQDAFTGKPTLVLIKVALYYELCTV